MTQISGNSISTEYVYNLDAVAGRGSIHLWLIGVDVLPSTLFGIALALHLVLAVVLVRKYLQTRDVGFVWLGMAVVIWPVISAVLEQGERALMSHAFMHQSVGVYPFNLLARGDMTAGTVVIALSSLHQLIGVALLLAAVFYLGRAKNNVQTA